ncbi:MAG: glutamate decarboxylase [Simkaniaceae bacterium]|jgi:glutamate decarboxylase|nr:MAG: glutamate decarboxylase [Simkaniaceae bacterium]
MLTKKNNLSELEDSEKGHASTYSSRFFKEDIPKYEFPENSMPANAAYQMIHDELNMDANPSLNLASFVTTWMEPEAEKLITENLHKNFIDHDEYPQTEVIHNRCVNMLARLFNAPEECKSIGAATIGSSEAIMLGLLAHKWKWKKRAKKGAEPNIIFGAEVHVCWEKFARYFDVEMRVIPLEKGRYVISADEVEKRIDENTIAVGAILGTTYSGQADPIEEINDLLLKIKNKKGWDIPLHVDAASGGFVIPFTSPDFVWDFRLEQVKSINVSGHKYGLVYPGIGWIIYRDESDFPKDLVFKVNYLGGWMPTYTLNFSCNASFVLAQYYNFLRLGREGYNHIMTNCVANAQYLSQKLKDSEKFEMINDAQMLPIVAVKLKDSITNYTVYDLSSKLRERGWVMAAYTMPENAQEIALLRVVVRENFSRDMADILFQDIENACAALDSKGGTKKPEIDGKHRPIC